MKNIVAREKKPHLLHGNSFFLILSRSLLVVHEKLLLERSASREALNSNQPDRFSLFQPRLNFVKFIHILPIATLFLPPEPLSSKWKSRSSSQDDQEAHCQL